MTGTTRRGFLLRMTAAAAAAGHLDFAAGTAAPLPPPAPDADPEAFWTALQREFLPRPGVISMNSANMAPSPRSVGDAVARATRDIDADVSYQNRAKYTELRETTRSRIARLLGVDGDEIALVRNASEANNIVVGGLPLAAGDEVLLLDQNHPTNNVAWDVRAARFGFTVKRISLPDPSSAAEVLAAFEAATTPRTRVIGFSHVSNSTGLMIPARPLCRWARARGIYTHVDGAQTFAALPLDLRDLECDSFSASAQKWLMGPREIGLLYLRRDRIEPMWPGVVGVGWGDGPETTTVGARKFETMGQRDDAATAGLAAAIDFHERIGPDRVGARIRELADRLHAGLLARGIPLVTPAPAELRLGVVIVRADPAAAKARHEQLYRRYQIIGSNTGGVRFSPNICNTLADIDRTIEIVAALG